MERLDWPAVYHTSGRPSSCKGFRLAEQAVSGDQNRADDDRAIGDVEGRPVISGDMEIQEIHDTAIEQPVQRIAERAADDKSAGNRHQAGAGLAQQEPPDAERDGDRQCGQNERSGRRIVAEQAETDAAIVNQNQVEEGRHLNRPSAAFKDGQNPGFGYLIRREDDRRNRKSQTLHHSAA